MNLANTPTLSRDEMLIMRILVRTEVFTGKFMTYPSEDTHLYSMTIAYKDHAFQLEVPLFAEVTGEVNIPPIYGSLSFWD